MGEHVDRAVDGLEASWVIAGPNAFWGRGRSEALMQARETDGIPSVSGILRPVDALGRDVQHDPFLGHQQLGMPGVFQGRRAVLL